MIRKGSLVDERTWIVKGEKVGLTATTKEDYIARRERFGNEPLMSGLQWPFMPPHPREFWEELYDAQVITRESMVFEVRLIDSRECVGEVSLRGLKWPDASCELGVTVWASPERAKGYGTEAGYLAAAYAFDGLGVHRVWLGYIASNKAVARIAETLPGKKVGRLRESAWAFGKFHDLVIMDCLRSEFPPHPATKHLREVD